MALVPLTGAAVVAARSDVKVGQLLRDPLDVLDAPFHVGLVSNLGVLLWGASTALCAFLVVVARRRGTRDQVVLFVAGAAASGWLLLDDSLMLREQVLPAYLGLPGRLSHAVSLVLVGALLLAHRRLVVHDGEGLLLPTAVALLLTSFGIDQLHDLGLVPGLDLPGSGAVVLLVEDGLKLIGILVWFASFWCRGLDLAERPLRPPVEAED